MSRTPSIVHETTETFLCIHCGRAVEPAESGTKNRNHCPYCLHSRHVDLHPGDRRSSCRGLMRPIAVWVVQKEWRIIHRCDRCGFIRANRIAGDDDEVMLLQLAVRPLTELPFPLGSIPNGMQERNVHEC